MTMPSNDNIKGISGTSNVHGNGPVNSSNKSSHSFIDYKKRQPNNPYGSSSKSSLINSQVNNSGSNNNSGYESYRRTSGSQGTYYGSRSSKPYYYSEDNSGKRPYGGGRSISQDGSGNKPYFGYSKYDNSSTNKQDIISQQQQRNMVSSNNRMQDSPSNKPSLSITTANEYDSKLTMDKSLSAGLKTPKSSGYYQGSSYNGNSYSRYQTGGPSGPYGSRKGYYGGGKYGAPDRDRPLSAHVNMNSDSGIQDSDGPVSISSDFDKSGDSYNYYNTKPYGKASNNRPFFTKPVKVNNDYYSSPKGGNNSSDAFYGSKYSNYQYAPNTGNNTGSNNQVGNNSTINPLSSGNNTYESYGKYSNKLSSYYEDDSKYSPKFNRSQRKYSNWYGPNSQYNNTHSHSYSSFSQVDDEPSGVHPKSSFSKEKSTDIEADDDEENTTNNTTVGNIKDENTTSNNDDDDEFDDEFDDDISKRETKGSSSLLRTKIKHNTIVYNKEIASNQVDAPLNRSKKGLAKPSQDDDFQLDADIDIHFDDEEEDEQAEDIEEESNEAKEENIVMNNKKIDKVSTILIKKETTPTTGKLFKQEVKKDPAKMYIKVEEGCIFPLNRLDSMLFDLENRPREEIIEEQKYLIKNPVRDLKKGYPFFKHNFLIDSQVYRPKLVSVFKNSKKHIYLNTLLLRKKHCLFDEDWQVRCEENEKQLLEMYPDYESQLFEHEDGSAADADNQNNTSTNNRRSRHQIGATSEAEFEKLLHQIQMNDPLYKAEQHAAKIPCMIMNPLKKYGQHFVNVNNLVTDKSIFSNRLKTDPIDNFNEEEISLFNEAYVAHPKKFGKISALMGGLRTPEECVRHYYNTKRSISYKQLVLNKRNRKNSGRKKAAKTRPSNKRAASSTSDNSEASKPVSKSVEFKQKISQEPELVPKSEKQDIKKSETGKVEVIKTKQLEKTAKDQAEDVSENAVVHRHSPIKNIDNPIPVSRATTTMKVELPAEPINTEATSPIDSTINEHANEHINTSGIIEKTSSSMDIINVKPLQQYTTANTTSAIPSVNNNAEAVTITNSYKEMKVVGVTSLLSADTKDIGDNHINTPKNNNVIGSSPNISNYINISPTNNSGSEMSSQSQYSDIIKPKEIAPKPIQSANERKREALQLEATTTSKKGKAVKKRKTDKKKEASPSDQPKKEKKKKTSTMYWSVAETAAFPKILFKYGSQWDLIAKEMGTKSALMVRNFFGKNADKEGWREEVARIDKEREETNRIAKELANAQASLPPLGIFNEDRSKTETKPILTKNQYIQSSHVSPVHSEANLSVNTTQSNPNDSISSSANAQQPPIISRSEPRRANISSLVNQNVSAPPKISISSIINDGASSLPQPSTSRVFVSNLISGPSTFAQNSISIERSSTPTRTPISNLINSSPGRSIVRPPSAKPNIINLLNNPSASDNQTSTFYRHDNTASTRSNVPSSAYASFGNSGSGGSNNLPYSSGNIGNNASTTTYSSKNYLGHQYSTQRQPFQSSFMQNLHSSSSSVSNSGGIRLPSLLNNGNSFTQSHHHTTSSFDSLIAAANRERENQQQQQQQHDSVQTPASSGFYGSQNVYGSSKPYYNNGMDSNKQ